MVFPLNDVATNHLPHNNDALRAMAEQQGIVLDAPPADCFSSIPNS